MYWSWPEMDQSWITPVNCNNCSVRCTKLFFFWHRQLPFWSAVCKLNLCTFFITISIDIRQCVYFGFLKCQAFYIYDIIVICVWSQTIKKWKYLALDSRMPHNFVHYAPVSFIMRLTYSPLNILMLNIQLFCLLRPVVISACWIYVFLLLKNFLAPSLSFAVICKLGLKR